MADLEIIKVDYAPIELVKVLKLGGISSGGEAKQLIHLNQVRVNQQIISAKRARIYDLDIIEIDGYCWQVEVSKPAPLSNAHKAINQRNNSPQAKSEPAQQKPTQRRKPKLS